MMKKLSRPCVYLTLLLAAGCSSLKPAPAEPVACPEVVEPPACPACPVVEPVVCPEPQVIEKIVTVPAPTPQKPTSAGKLNLPIVGAVEWARIEPGDIRLPARIDTGAASTSLHAENIELIEKDGKRWVKFSVLDPATKKQVDLQRPLRRKIVIKQGDNKKTYRYVVRLHITLADSRAQVDVTLNERDNMEYALQIGRNLLVDTVIVDVSRQQQIAK